jgi:DNA repair exonuclease SbcCD nuclease subunit
MGVKLVVHTGDILNSNRPGPDAIACLRGIHRKLIAHQARMIVISGNHDQTDPPWPTLLEPDRNMMGITVQDRMVFSFQGVSFFCLPFVPLDQFRSIVWPEAHVLLCHLQIQELIGYESINALPIRDLPGEKFSLILVGDVHIYKTVNHPDYPKCIIGYTGSSELCSESEPSEKFWTLVEMEGPTVKIMKPIHIPTRKVFRRVLEKVEDIDPNIVEIKTQWDNYRSETADMREPIVFVEYPSDVTGVMERFRTAFNPDLWVLRFKAKLRLMSPTGVPMPPTERELTVAEIMRSNLAMRQDLIPVAEQLINTELDPNAAIDSFIEARLRTIAEPSGTPDGGALAVS